MDSTQKRGVKLLIFDGATRSNLRSLEEAINKEVEDFIASENARIVQVEVKHHGPHHDPPIIYLYLLYEKA